MFEWFFGKRGNEFEKQVKESFNSVKKDMDSAGKWIKHLNEQDKQLFELLNDLKQELSSIRDDVGGLKEAFEMAQEGQKSKQLFEKSAISNKQTAVYGVEEAVQTAVQTDNFYGILKSLTGNERLLIFALLNSELKLSYEDIALLLGKEKSTIRGQINAIKQKSEGLIEEYVEKSGKKRVYIPEEIRQKLQKYAKVRVRGKKKIQKTDENG